MLYLGFRPFDKTEEKLGTVAYDDEGWCQGWSAVVLHYEIVPLELPEDVCVTLNHLEGVATGKGG